MKFQKKPVVVEAITFDELVAHGKASGASVVNGLPWSFTYGGHPITHENDECYLIPTLEGAMRMGRGDMLITGVKGEIYPCKSDIFTATYAAVREPSEAPIWPRVDQFMSDADLTAAAEKIKSSVDWSKLPKLAAIFEHRPSVNRYWHELVALTLLSLEHNGAALNKRNAERDGE